jgi:hypothetical protein
MNIPKQLLEQVENDSADFRLVTRDVLRFLLRLHLLETRPTTVPTKHSFGKHEPLPPHSDGDTWVKHINDGRSVGHDMMVYCAEVGQFCDPLRLPVGHRFRHDHMTDQQKKVATAIANTVLANADDPYATASENHLPCNSKYTPTEGDVFPRIAPICWWHIKDGRMMRYIGLNQWGAAELPKDVP